MTKTTAFIQADNGYKYIIKVLRQTHDFGNSLIFWNIAISSASAKMFTLVLFSGNLWTHLILIKLKQNGSKSMANRRGDNTANDHDMRLLFFFRFMFIDLPHSRLALKHVMNEAKRELSIHSVFFRLILYYHKDDTDHRINLLRVLGNCGALQFYGSRKTTRKWAELHSKLCVCVTVRVGRAPEQENTLPHKSAPPWAPLTPPRYTRPPHSICDGTLCVRPVIHFGVRESGNGGVRFLGYVCFCFFSSCLLHHQVWSSYDSLCVFVITKRVLMDTFTEEY